MEYLRRPFLEAHWAIRDAYQTELLMMLAVEEVATSPIHFLLQSLILFTSITEGKLFFSLFLLNRQPYRSSSQSMNSLPPVDHIAQRPILPSSSQQQQQQQSNGHRTLPRLSLGGFGGSSSSNREPVSFGHRASYSTSGPLSGRDFYGHSAPLSGNGLEPYHPALRHPGHSRHASADFANNMHPGQIYGWKEGPYGMEPLFPVKASGPACGMIPFITQKLTLYPQHTCRRLQN